MVAALFLSFRNFLGLHIVAATVADPVVARSGWQTALDICLPVVVVVVAVVAPIFQFAKVFQNVAHLHIVAATVADPVDGCQTALDVFLPVVVAVVVGAVAVLVAAVVVLDVAAPFFQFAKAFQKVLHIAAATVADPVVAHSDWQTALDICLPVDVVVGKGSAVTPVAFDGGAALERPQCPTRPPLLKSPTSSRSRAA